MPKVKKVSLKLNQYIDEFGPDYLDELHEGIILYRRTMTSCRGDVDYLRVGLNGTHPSKTKWI